MIVLDVLEEEKVRCLSFATTIIRGGNQFDRFNKSMDTQIIRTYVGKLAEYLFLHFLQSRAIDKNEGDMFKIYEGAENADTYDFLLPDGRSIDIKTASLPFHTRIMVPMSQFHLRKDFYVGIKLNFITTNNRIDPNNIQTAWLYGYINREVLENQPTQNFGEGPCKAYSLNNLLEVQKLINMFHESGGV